SSPSFQNLIIGKHTGPVWKLLSREPTNEYRREIQHQVTSAPLRLGAALLVILILIAGVSPLIYSILNDL
ncbi:MAG: hypothetical protein AABZ63_08070, partial [Actinomycetota bacterium]